MLSANSILGSSNRAFGGPSTGQDLSSVSRNSLMRAIDFGESFAKNVSRVALRMGGSRFSKGSPEYFHAQFLKPKSRVSLMTVVEFHSETCEIQ